MERRRFSVHKTWPPKMGPKRSSKRELKVLLDICKRRINYRPVGLPLGDGIVKMAIVSRLCQYFDVKLIGDTQDRVDLFNLFSGVSLTLAEGSNFDIRLRSGGSSAMHLITRLGKKYIPQINEQYCLSMPDDLSPIPPECNPPFNASYNWSVVLNMKTAAPKQYPHWGPVCNFLTQCGVPWKVIDDHNEFSLVQLAQVIRQSKLYVGLDSGPTHLAAACRIPGIVLFSKYYQKTKWEYPSIHDYLQFYPDKPDTLDPKLVIFKIEKKLKSLGVIN